MINTGQLSADAATVQRIMTFIPFRASKVKFISPKAGRPSSTHLGGRLEFIIKQYPDAASEADFNSDY